MLLSKLFSVKTVYQKYWEFVWWKNIVQQYLQAKPIRVTLNSTENSERILIYSTIDQNLHFMCHENLNMLKIIFLGFLISICPTLMLAAAYI